MRTYELTLVIDPDLSSEDIKKLIAKIKKIVEELKGQVRETTDWGRKELAYPIKKKSMGCYFLWQISLPEESPNDLDKKLKVEENIIRYLLIRKELVKESPTSPRKNRGSVRGTGGKHGAKVAQ